MHKLLKASIAGAAGIALLAGGAGTFAVWNQSAQVSVTQIQSGELSLTPVANGEWFNGTTKIDNISTYRIVPGDTLTYKQDLTVKAVGTNLKAELSWNALQTTSQIAGVTAELAVSGTGLSKKSDAVYTVTPSSNAITAKAELTVKFDQNATTGQNGTFKLSDISFTLAQKTS